MPQIIVAQNRNGIVLAAENQALHLDAEGNEASFPANRLLPLTSHCALMTAGAADGVKMGHALKRFVQEESLSDVQDLHGAALAFLSTEYERFMRKVCELMPIDPIHQISFILAGKTTKDLTMPFRTYYLWTKKKLPQLDSEEISFAFCLPRRMGLEYQLNKICREQTPLHQILAKVKEGLDRLKQLGEVNADVSCAFITHEGYQDVSPS